MSQLLQAPKKDRLNSYQQAQTLIQGVLSSNLVRNDTVFSHWIEGSHSFWYERATAAGKVFRLVDADQGSNEPAFDHQLLAHCLTDALAQEINPDDLPIALTAISLSPLAIHFTAAEQHWVFDGRALTQVGSDKDKSNDNEVALPTGVLSPDGQHLAFIREHNLWLKNMTTGQEHALTDDGNPRQPYAISTGSGPTVQALWSADSRTLLSLQLDLRQIPTMPCVHHVPADGSLRPQVVEQIQALPGDEHIECYRLLAIDTHSGEQQWADYSPLPQCRTGAGFFTGDRLGWWGQDHQQAYFIEVVRGSQTVRVVEWNPQTGATRILFEEHSASGIKLSHGILERPLFQPLPASNELIWLSERSGWAHLYLYDLNTGDLKHALTEGEWLVRDILHVDIEQREVLVQTAGRDSAISPYYRDICRLNIDSGELTPLVTGNYDHVVLESDSLVVGICQQLGKEQAEVHGISSDGQYLVATRSRVDTAPETLLINRNGNEPLLLESADISCLPKDWQWPEAITVKAADGQTDLYGVVYRPPGFSPDKHYPVLDYSSVHPAYSYVPHASFSSGIFCGEPYLMGAAYAALGFIVVAMETPGMPYRSQAFQDNRDNGFGFADRIAGLRQLAQREPSMDLERVGLVGCDGITSPVNGLLDHPDFYQVGIVVAFEDFRFEPAAFVESTLGHATIPTLDIEDRVASLRGKLLLIHGMLDTVTPIASTLRLVEALRKANKDFDQLLLPNDHHEISSYALRRSWDYLVEHLHGEQPPKNFALKTAWDFLMPGGH